MITFSVLQRLFERMIGICVSDTAATQIYPQSMRCPCPFGIGVRSFCAEDWNAITVDCLRVYALETAGSGGGAALLAHLEGQGRHRHL